MRAGMCITHVHYTRAGTCTTREQACASHASRHVHYTRAGTCTTREQARALHASRHMHAFRGGQQIPPHQDGREAVALQRSSARVLRQTSRSSDRGGTSSAGVTARRQPGRTSAQQHVHARASASAATASFVSAAPAPAMNPARAHDGARARAPAPAQLSLLALAARRNALAKCSTRENAMPGARQTARRPPNCQVPAKLPGARRTARRPLNPARPPPSIHLPTHTLPQRPLPLPTAIPTHLPACTPAPHLGYMTARKCVPSVSACSRPACVSRPPHLRTSSTSAAGASLLTEPPSEGAPLPPHGTDGAGGDALPSAQRM
eukprot:364826-Chlamydomonas_euryale.AAC.4